MARARRHTGFTLLEMMVVIALIGLVSAIVAVSVIGIYDRERIEITKRQLQAGQAALKTHYLTFGRYPDRLDQLVEKNVVDELPHDAWDRDLKYQIVDGKPHLTSAGKDGVFGTEDDLTRQ
jgi:general secretion pathway protein G